jgi:hypothetical protein
MSRRHHGFRAYRIAIAASSEGSALSSSPSQAEIVAGPEGLMRAGTEQEPIGHQVRTNPRGRR